MERAPSVRQQVGALCWRRQADRVEPLLITSRDTGRWVIPKGNLMSGVADWTAAAIEAREETGVCGEVEPILLGSYPYAKRVWKGRSRPCRVGVYALEVLVELGAGKESGQRKRRWMSLVDAAEAVDEPELASLLKGFVSLR